MTVDFWQTLRNTLLGEPDGSGRPRVAQLDALRGSAALLIFLVHYNVLMGHWLPAHTLSTAVAGFVEMVAHCGTDLFFTLSGYLVYGSLMTREQPFRRYLSRRFGRIYPTFFFVVCVYLLIFLIDPADSKLPGQVLPALLYVLANLALLAGVLPVEPIVAPAWSLSYLATFYLAAPLLVWQLHLSRWRRSQRVLLFVAIAAVLLAWGYLGGGPVRLAMFIGGMLLYEFRPRDTALSGARFGAVLFAVAVVLMAVIAAFDLPAVTRYIALFALFPIATGACVAAPTVRGLLSWGWLQYLGKITLSYIMIHGLTLRLLLLGAERFVPRHWHGPALFWALLLPAFLATTASAALVYAYVEDASE